MSTPQKAKMWMQENCPSEISNIIRSSKYYPGKDIWFFTFPCSFFDKKDTEYLNIMLQKEFNPDKFIFLKVPFSFLRQNKNRFDIRSNGDKFDLHISGKKRNWLVDERANGICFAGFEQEL